MKPISAPLSSLIGVQSYPSEIVAYASAGDRLADHREIDLLFLDIELTTDRPGLDGMALAGQIRERATGTRCRKVPFISAGRVRRSEVPACRHAE